MKSKRNLLGVLSTTCFVISVICIRLTDQKKYVVKDLLMPPLGLIGGNTTIQLDPTDWLLIMKILVNHTVTAMWSRDGEYILTCTLYPEGKGRYSVHKRSRKIRNFYGKLVDNCFEPKLFNLTKEYSGLYFVHIWSEKFSQQAMHELTVDDFKVNLDVKQIKGNLHRLHCFLHPCVQISKVLNIDFYDDCDTLIRGKTVQRFRDNKVIDVDLFQFKKSNGTLTIHCTISSFGIELTSGKVQVYVTNRAERSITFTCVPLWIISRIIHEFVS